ncbi:hypothetical protein [[Clostridium] fimetarium]|uniref:Carboxypeptidase regulatory-like domain-containing protein n=1 Tax=[Clostridium] fimetarium TaxID=99656 RepID=A0A1I0Q911_9FIRM|nr:hypothetical protein [[Clostridium] fimetarium]SEW23298.1 hypothetical protein SAMN05421659_10790 [[Clostridium] fimetarium]
MEQEHNEYYIEKVLIHGYIHYKEGGPVQGAIVILEKIPSEYNEELQEEQKQVIYLANTVTSSNGEFCFFVTDRTSYYKIKVFDNNN